ncbi:MaoC family dehydratase [Streptomyces triticirhizae]
MPPSGPVFSRPPGLLASYARALRPQRASIGRALPARTLRLSRVPHEPARLRRYAALCGFPDPTAGPLPVTYPHLFAFPLTMRLLTARDFPHPALGLVHLADAIERSRPLAPDEELSVAVHAEAAEPHPRGTAFAVVAEVRDADGAAVWRSTSTYLRRGRADAPHAGAEGGERAGSRARRASAEHAGAEGGAAGSGRAGPGGRGGPASSAGEVDGNAPTVTECWSLPADLGRRYARVSGDRNPIHLHPLTARPFGFRRPIAHGMWTTARALAALDEVLPESFAVNVRFRAPAELPSRPTFHAAPTADGGHAFGLTAATGRTLLTGEITPCP